MTKHFKGFIILVLLQQVLSIFVFGLIAFTENYDVRDAFISYALSGPVTFAVMAVILFMATIGIDKLIAWYLKD